MEELYRGEIFDSYIPLHAITSGKYALHMYDNSKSHRIVVIGDDHEVITSSEENIYIIL